MERDAGQEPTNARQPPPDETDGDAAPRRPADATRATTIGDVARQAGVSIATVSRVLNDSASVNVEMATRVRAAMKALQYRPNGAARALRANRSRIIGLLIADIQNPFFTALICGVENVAQRNGYSLILCNSDEDPRKERQYIEVLCAEHVVGAIVVPTHEKLPAVRLFHDRRIPVVAVDRRIQDPEIDAVVIDNTRGAREAVSHLIANGARRIGIITGPRDTTTGAERLEGYRQALRDADLTHDPALECRGSFKEASGHALAEKLLALTPPIDALFTANNLMTLGALEVLHARGLRVPQDIAMVAFDEMPWAALSAISLTTVTQPVYELGITAAMRLFQRLDHPGILTRQEIVLEPKLIVRGSSRPRIGRARAVRPPGAGATGA